MRLLIKIGLGVSLVPLLLAIQPSPAISAEYKVVIDKLKFGPVPSQLHVGDVIIWQNDDILHHTATARDASFDVDLPAKSEGRTVIGKSGDIGFYCRFHPGMTGHLVVKP